MNRQLDECYVLETLELGEADLIVTLLSLEHGKVRAVAPAARRSRRRFGGALEPLTRVRAEWTERAGRELHRLESAECGRSFAAMQSEPRLQAACAVLAEIARTFAHEGQAEPAAFRLLGAVLEALERGGDPPSLVRYFEFWSLRVHGLLPELDHCIGCADPLEPTARSWVVEGAGLRCTGCRSLAGGSAVAWTAEDRTALALFAGHPPTAIPALARARRGGALERLLRGSLERFAERSFRSYRHLEGALALDRGGGA